jgi:D-amino-acid dehydrogenase
MYGHRKQETDVLVIGAGAVGICCAWYLSQQGRQVTVVDQGGVCSGCSHGNAGLIVPSHCVPLAAPGVIAKALKWVLDPESPFYIQPRLSLDLLSWLWRFQAACSESRANAGMRVIRDLSVASLKLFEELAGLEGMNFGLEKRGLLSVFKTEEALEDGAKEASLLHEIGIETRVLSRAETHQMEPTLRRDLAGAVFYPHDAHLVPGQFVRQLAQHIEGKVALRPSTEVLGFETAGNRITAVQTTRGTFSAQEVVLAAGSWLPLLAKELRLSLPLQPAKGYSVTVRRPSACPVIPALLAETKVAVTPMGDMLRFGGTLEMAGLDLSINKRRVEAILRAVPQYYAELRPKELEVLEIWRGLRPCTPDGLPYLGRSRAYQNLVVAAGHAMLGISLSPISGKLVAELVTGQSPSIDLTSLAVERYG